MAWSRPRVVDGQNSRVGQDGASAGESWLLRTGLSVTVWSLAAVATVLAASGQVEFARWAGITDIRAYGVPAVLELVAVAFLLIGYRRARRGDSAATLWLLAAVVGAFAVYTNVVHTGGKSGLVFGAASAITLVLWFVKLRDDYRKFQRQTGQATQPRPKLGALWLVAPRLSTRAWIVATRRRISTVDEAVGYAEVWRAVYEDARAARINRRLARRTAWRSVAEVAGGARTELPRTAEVAAVQVLQRSADAPEALAARAVHPVEPVSITAAPTEPAPLAAASAQPAPITAAPAEPAPWAVESAGPPPRAVPPPGAVPPPRAVPLPGAVSPPRVVAPGAPNDGRDGGMNGAMNGTPPRGDRALRDQVFAYLDQHAGPEIDLDEADDPYLAWSVAGALGVSPEAIASHVRAWRQSLQPGPPADAVPVSPAVAPLAADGYRHR